MNLYSMTDDAILLELGGRLAAQRLRKNISQESMAQAIGVSRLTYSSLERGKGSLSTLVGALRHLDSLESLDSFLPAPQFSPLEARKLKGKTKQRATAQPRNRANDDKELDW